MGLQPTLAPALTEEPEVTEQHEISPWALPTALAVARAVACGTCCHQHCSGSHVSCQDLRVSVGTVPGQGGCHDGPKSTHCKISAAAMGSGSMESLACLGPGPKPEGLLPATEILPAPRVPAALGRVAIPKKCRDRQRAAMECMIQEL